MGNEIAKHRFGTELPAILTLPTLVQIRLDEADDSAGILE